MTSQGTLAHRLAVAIHRGRAAFDARAPRERLLIAAAVLVALGAVVDALWFSPALRTWSQVGAQRHRLFAALATARSQEAIRSSGKSDPRAQIEDAIRQVRARVEALDRELNQQTDGLVGADRMVAVLDRILAGQPQVKVLAMRSLPRTDLLSATAVPAGAPQPAAAASGSARKPVAALYRHGVELTLEGNYADLAAYVRALETQPQRLLPGGLQFRVQSHPASTLTLRLYTVSMDRHWLEL